VLFGVVGTQGVVEPLSRPIPVRNELVQIVRKSEALAQNLRFAAPCVEGRCGQWSAGRCTVPMRVFEQLGKSDEGRLSWCGLRPECRWYAQEGLAACRVCPQVRTHVSDALETGEQHASSGGENV